MTTTIGTGNAVLDPSGRYRYRLWREWPVLGGTGTVAFIMLNPSTADAAADDPTIRRCIRFAQGWGYARVEIGNLFAWRATEPRELMAAARSGVDVVGPLNDRALLSLANQADLVVCAWGAHPYSRGHRPAQLARILDRAGAETACLGTTHSGAPRHPLRLAADTPAEPFDLTPLLG